MWLTNQKYFPFLYKHDLTYLLIRKPTEAEVAKLTIYDITTDDCDPAGQCDKMWTFEPEGVFDEDEPSTLMTYLHISRTRNVSRKNPKEMKRERTLGNVQHLRLKIDLWTWTTFRDAWDGNWLMSLKRLS